MPYTQVHLGNARFRRAKGRADDPVRWRRADVPSQQGTHSEGSAIEVRSGVIEKVGTPSHTFWAAWGAAYQAL